MPPPFPPVMRGRLAIFSSTAWDKATAKNGSPMRVIAS